MQNSPWHPHMNSKIFPPRKPAKPAALLVIRKEEQDPNLAAPVGWLRGTKLIVGENFPDFSNVGDTGGFCVGTVTSKYLLFEVCALGSS